MIRMVRGAIMCAAVMLVTLTPLATAEPASDWKCNAITEVPIDERIAACTALLESGRFGRQAELRAHFNRAAAHYNKGEFERAVADYTAVIGVYPKNIYAYRSRAAAYTQLGDYDHAISDHSTAVQLNPRDRNAYYGRGFAYHRSGDYDRAIADYTEAILLRQRNPDASSEAAGMPQAKLSPDGTAELDANDLRLLVARGAAYDNKGDPERAISDFDQAIRLNPKDVWAYRRRAAFHLQNGLLSKSLDDLNQSSSLDPKNAYVALWARIVRKRADQPDNLSEAAMQVDMSKWPAPLVRLFLGETTAEEVLAAADDPNPTKKRGQTCEANFYIAELMLERGQADEARRLFELATADCPKTFLEWRVAKSELDVLRASH